MRWKRIEESTVGDVTVFSLAGQKGKTTQEGPVRHAIRELTLQDRCKVVINLREVTSIDALGFGELRYCQWILSEHGQPLKLSTLQDQLMRVFVVTGQTKVYQIFDTDDDAVASFGA